mmetsp:Transcript_15352/g.36806  ORF Transcript_15352/g.36806 Transcript_15352/m.36806 type:complete len:227 (-) Transcript_15352:542-1222(-)
MILVSSRPSPLLQLDSEDSCSSPGPRDTKSKGNPSLELDSLSESMCEIPIMCTPLDSSSNVVSFASKLLEPLLRKDASSTGPTITSGDAAFSVHFLPRGAIAGAKLKSMSLSLFNEFVPVEPPNDWLKRAIFSSCFSPRGAIAAAKLQSMVLPSADSSVESPDESSINAILSSCFPPWGAMASAKLQSTTLLTFAHGMVYTEPPKESLQDQPLVLEGEDDPKSLRE